jgi:hypothetical protein
MYAYVSFGALVYVSTVARVSAVGISPLKCRGPLLFRSKIQFSECGRVLSIFNGFGRILSSVQKQMYLVMHNSGLLNL